MSEFTQGMCADGAAILKDGVMLTIEEIIELLRQGDRLMGRGEPVASASCEKALCDSGVFKGAEGLRQFSECQEFWDEQPYGTRFYFGDGNYLHRDVLRAAVRLLDSAKAPAVDGTVIRDAVRLDWLIRKLSGKALRDAGVIYSAGTSTIRSAIDSAMGEQQ